MDTKFFCLCRSLESRVRDAGGFSRRRHCWGGLSRSEKDQNRRMAAPKCATSDTLLSAAPVDPLVHRGGGSQHRPLYSTATAITARVGANGVDMVAGRSVESSESAFHSWLVAS
jgi:hypothetical protein